MATLQKLFKQTAIYGIATVLPRLLSFLLVPLHTSKSVLKSTADYGDVSLIFTYFVLFNVVLAYGMETAFFRFYNRDDYKKQVASTASISLIISSVLFFVLAYAGRFYIAELTHIKPEYIVLVIWILLLDALVIIPFAYLRATEKPIKYTVIKVLNVSINVGLNVFFLLYLKNLSESNLFFESFYKPDFQINYIFIANLIASAVTLLLLLPFYLKLNYKFNKLLWKKMLRYAFPVLIAGVAFSINETFDRVLLERLLPADVARSQIGMYSACYKLAIFMALFSTAFRLGVEPYFFSHAKTKSPQKNYAKIMELFIAMGAVILVTVTVFIDLVKPLIITNEAYWEAMWIVPIILLAYLCLGIYHNLAVWYKITDRTRFGAYISVIGAVATLLINVWLIPIIGFKGSAIATLSAYALMMLLSFFIGKLYYPIPYNLKRIGLYLAISITASTVLFYGFRAQYSVTIPVWLVILSVILYFERHTIKQLIPK